MSTKDLQTGNAARALSEALEQEVESQELEGVSIGGAARLEGITSPLAGNDFDDQMNRFGEASNEIEESLRSRVSTFSELVHTERLEYQTSFQGIVKNLGLQFQPNLSEHRELLADELGKTFNDGRRIAVLLQDEESGNSRSTSAKERFEDAIQHFVKLSTR